MFTILTQVNYSYISKKILVNRLKGKRVDCLVYDLDGSCRSEITVAVPKHMAMFKPLSLHRPECFVLK